MLQYNLVGKNAVDAGLDILKYLRDCAIDFAKEVSQRNRL